MKIRIEKLDSKYQSVNEILRLAEQYSNDLSKYFSMNISDFFNFVKNIKYVMDKKPIEIVKRPSLILKAGSADCKKKTILCIAYFIRNKISFRLIGSSTRKNKNIHHIFPQIFINGSFKNFDATYSKNKLFEKKIVTNFEIFYERIF